MTNRAGITRGLERATQSRVCDRHVTRRAFVEVVAGGLAAASVGGIGIVRAQPVATTAEPEGPDHFPRRRIKVLDSEISYIDIGNGEPVVFLHGNPTWSYQWRNIIPHVSPHRRCLAPDLVGMGWSGKSPSKAYRFVDHARYMDAWLEALQLTHNVTLVGHDWGGPISFYRARRYPDQIKAIAYFEAIVLPRRWEDYPGDRGTRFRRLRSPDGERLVLDENFFVEVVLPEFCRTLPNQREITVTGLHHLQEDSPNEIGAAIRDFVIGLRA